MNTENFLTTVDHAARMNDRWLFVAAFALLLSVGGAVIYWLVKRLQSALDEHKHLRHEHHESLTKVIGTQNETALKLALCIDHNTAALQECAFELRRFQERN